MKYVGNLTFLYIGQFLLFYITIFYLFSSEHIYYFIGQYIFFILLFKFLSKKQGFLLLISYNLMTVIVYLVMGFTKQWGTSMQIKVIFYHLILVFNAGVTYGFIYLSKELEEENIHLRKKVKALTQYEDASKLLTKQEFKERSSLIKKAMERRGEEGYEIYFHLKQQGIYAQYAVFYTLTNLALETFRNQYDLVGKWDDSSFVILLQNTDKEGMEIALNRYLSKVDEKLEMNQEELMIEMEVIAPEKEGVNIA